MNQKEESRRLWVPDFVCYNLYIRNGFDGVDEKSLPQVFYNGTVYWSRPGLMEIMHPFLIYNFPYDRQFVVLVFSAWITKDHIQTVDTEFQWGLPIFGEIP